MVSRPREVRARENRISKPRANKVKPFSGDGADPREFLASFEGSYGHLKGAEKCARFCQYFRAESAAAQWLASLDEAAKTDWEKLATMFKLRWGVQETSEKQGESSAAGGTQDPMLRDEAAEGEAEEEVARVLIPEIPPSPRSHWIDLHPIDDFQHHDLRSKSLSANSPEQAIYDRHTVPEEPPAPLSYWIDLHAIDDAESLRDNLHWPSPPHSPAKKGLMRYIPEEPPAPLSYWIDLHSIEELRGDSVPAAAPDPASIFLDLHPLDAPVPESAPSPALLFLALHPSGAGAE
ncbi:hypothetical protein FIBSPDRAFT_959903 [Athelia psychrophila]|uniref:Uncharacterized protein n=1 Tax=Athelia psychrophila TaxID=1759441 RepID=A0A166D079_9AGAM|nr:hypothetical protein FIBSPDRAFT_959903 [Fibularhizoctonia sp. CBS 109695]